RVSESFSTSTAGALVPFRKCSLNFDSNALRALKYSGFLVSEYPIASLRWSMLCLDRHDRNATNMPITASIENEACTILAMSVTNSGMRPPHHSTLTRSYRHDVVW